VNVAETAVITIDKEIDVGGRPCKYESHVEPRLQEIYNWVKEGYTDYSIAENLGLHRATLIKYKEQYNNLTDIYSRALHERNRLVMNKMYLKATGERVSLNKQKLDKFGDKHDLIEEVYIPPDVNAADLFLRNNDPDYKSAKSVEITNNTTNNFQLPQLEQELLQIAEKRKLLEMQLGVDFEVVK
jgi:DNA-binding CsgD family transcriptional regulator